MRIAAHMLPIELDIGFFPTRRTKALAELREGEFRVVRLNVNGRDGRKLTGTDLGDTP